MPIISIPDGAKAAPVTIPTGFFVAPAPLGSSSHLGTIDSPWDLDFAFSGANGAITPGSTVWIRGGFYSKSTAFTTNMDGEVGSGVDNPDGKIKFRNFPGELAQITSPSDNQEVIQINNSYFWLWGSLGKNEGIEVFHTNLTRNAERGTNIWIAQTPQTGSKVLHVVTHDGSNGILNGGFSSNYDYGELEIYGNIAYNNGQLVMNDDVEGLVTHNFYLRHDNTQTGTKLRITKNILFNPFGYNFHCWSEHADGLHGIELTDNIAWGAGKLKFLTGVEVANIIIAAANGVGAPIRASVCSRNVLVQLAQDSGAGQMILGGLSNETNEGLTCEDNYMVGGEYDQFFAPIRIFKFQNGGVGSSLSFNRNELIQWTDGNAVEMTQTGSLAGYASWANNIWHSSSTMPAWRHGGVNKNFSTWKTDTGLGNSDTTGFSWYPGQPGGSNAFPTTAKVFVIRADKYNPGYAHVAIFNYAMQTSVAADLSTILANGDSYEVYNVQDIFGEPVLSGRYVGDLVEIPMTGKLAPKPIGVTARPPVTSGPFFDSFVVKKIS